MTLVHPTRCSVRLAIVAMALAVLGGCESGPTIEPHLVQPSAGRYNVVAIGGFCCAIPNGSVENGLVLRRSPSSGGAIKPFIRVYSLGFDGQRLFRRRLVEALRGSKAFAEVLDPAPALLPASALLLTAETWRQVTGGCNWAYMFDFRPCDTYYGANVELRDSKASPVVSFKIWWSDKIWRERSRDYRGSSKLGALADEAAAAIVGWSRGESLTR